MPSTCTSVFLISIYGASLAQRDSYLAQHSYLALSQWRSYKYVTNSINSPLIVFIFEPIWSMFQNFSKLLMYMYMYLFMLQFNSFIDMHMCSYSIHLSFHWSTHQFNYSNILSLKSYFATNPLNH